jgi:hypothetical protein
MGRRVSGVAIVLVLVLSGWLAQAPATQAADACFPETGHCIQGRFLAYWQEHGGLAINGFPLSDERQELLEDGHTYTVQYFERVRMELHPENQPPYDVLLGQFGRRVLQTLVLPPDTTPVTARSGYTYFAATGHNVSPRFLDYWQANGGLTQFGYPLTEEFTTTLIEEGTNQILATNGIVQYFERARFEYHPENAGTPYEILLGQFGRTLLDQVTVLQGNAGFFALYTTNTAVREQLGAPQGAVVQTPGAVQPFQGGQLVYVQQGGMFPPNPVGAASPAGVIYALCGDAQSGQWLPYDDTWSPDQPAGGGPGPQPGLYEPQRGFGKVWREHQEVRSCLGYATSADEQAVTLIAQRFQRGVLLVNATTERDAIYVLTYRTAGNGVSFVPGSGRYQRFSAPAP